MFHEKKSNSQVKMTGTSPVAQQVRLYSSSVEGEGLIPGWGTKIPRAVWCSQKVNKCTFKITTYNQKEEEEDGIHCPRGKSQITGNAIFASDV